MEDNANYLAIEEMKERQEKLLGIITGATVLMFFCIGVSLCSLARMTAPPYFPALNFAGITVLFIIPGMAAVILTVFQNIHRTGAWKYIDLPSEIFNANAILPISAIMADHFSIDGHYLGYGIFQLWLAVVAGILLAYWFNHAWRWRLIRTGRFN